jgi:hypothetical protein
MADRNDIDTDLDETMRNRKAAMEMAREAAFRGDPLAGSLFALEHLAEPFFLGVDEDPDDSDLDVFP